MKFNYPLSLKVSVWLLLNLLVLGAVAVAFFVAQGSMGWTALLSGRIGARVQAKANTIASEVALAVTPEERATLLRHFETEHNVELTLIRLDEIRTAGVRRELPPTVQARIEAMRRPFGPGGGRGRGGGPEEVRGLIGRGGLRPPPPGDMERKEGDGPSFPPPPGPGRPREFDRIIERAGTPHAYWLALRVGLGADERGRPPRGVMVIRMESFWQLLSFLEMEPWLFGGAVALGFSVLFWLPLVRDITGHISRLTQATERIAEGRFDTRVPGERRDELGKLGESVNRMAARLDAHMTGQKRFLGDVAHELCSPLARLQMATGILAEQAPRNLQPTIEDVRDEVHQMSALVNELLAFTKAGLKPRDVVLTAVDLPALVREAAAREDTANRTTLQIPADLRVTAEPHLLSRALGNLVRNALRYAGADSPVTVHAHRQGNQVVIAVDDEGPGVPPAALDRLGEPFFRPEEARTREGGGVGLGLAIVRSSIVACGGEIRFSNRTPRGFRAEVILPAATA